MMTLIKIGAQNNTSSNNIRSEINLDVQDPGIKIWLVDPTLQHSLTNILNLNIR